MAIKANIIIDQGSTFETKFVLEDSSENLISLTGFTGQSKMRKHHTSANAHTFTVSVDEGASAVVVSLTATQTALIESGRYIYDVELTSGNTVSRILEGIVTVTGQVTK